MRPSYKTLVIVMFIMLALSAGTLTAAPKEVAASIRVTPVKLAVYLKPGERTTTTLNITNTADMPARLSWEAQDFTRDAEGNYRFFPPGRRGLGRSAAGWVTLSHKTARLEPGETITVRVGLRAPRDAEPGGHFAMIFTLAEPVIKPSERRGALVIGRPRIGAMLQATVAGRLDSRARLDRLVAPGLSWGGPIEMRLFFKNRGNVHQDIAGRIQVVGRGYRRRLTINESTSLPKSTLILKTRLDKPPGFGRYIAKATIASRQGGQWKRSTAIWVVPWIDIPVVVLTAATLAALYVLTRRYSFRLVRRDAADG